MSKQGWLDGPLGCVYALEASRALHEAGGDVGVDVVVFCDEEGHYGSFLGSKSFTGLLTEEDIDKAMNRTDGTPMRDGLARAGYAGRPRVLVEPERYAGFFEAHIEQGATLDFAIAPAYWQTNWFRALCVAAFLALLWGLYQFRLRQVAQQFDFRL